MVVLSTQVWIHSMFLRPLSSLKEYINGSKLMITVFGRIKAAAFNQLNEAFDRSKKISSFFYWLMQQKVRNKLSCFLGIVLVSI